MIADSPILQPTPDSFQSLDLQFPHIPPEGYYYEVQPFKRNILSIWLHHPDIYTYTSDRVSTIWGFYNTKTRQYHAPINSTKCGDKVELKRTTPYSAMVRNLNPLESVLYGGV